MKRTRSDVCQSKWIIKGYPIGFGTRGTIYKARRKNGKKDKLYVAKLFYMYDSYKTEKLIYRILNKANIRNRIAPYMYDNFKCYVDIITKEELNKPQYVIITDRIKYTVVDAVDENIISYNDAYIYHARLLKRLHNEYNIAHGDPHMGNIMFDNNARGYLIDFEDGHVNATSSEKMEDIEILKYAGGSFGYNLPQTFIDIVIAEYFPNFIETGITLCKVCKRKAKYRCGNCINILYCGENCQIIDWKKNYHKYFCGK